MSTAPLPSRSPRDVTDDPNASPFDRRLRGGEEPSIEVDVDAVPSAFKDMMCSSP